MAVDRSAQANDRLFCWEQVSRTNRLFRISRFFAPRHCADRLLPLYALFSAVEQICSASSDEGMAKSRLGWWRNECLQAGIATSQHPLVRELKRTGASSFIANASMTDLFDGALNRLSAMAPADMDTLRSACIEIYRPQLELELAVSETQIAVSDFHPDLLARNGMHQLLRESLNRNEGGGFWWIPMNLLARHGVSREEISIHPGAPNVRKLLKQVLGEGAAWGADARDLSATPATDYSPARHVFAISGLYARKLQSLAAAAPDRFNLMLAQPGLADLFSAWASARRPG